jgi:hypothetical protein
MNLLLKDTWLPQKEAQTSGPLKETGKQIQATVEIVDFDQSCVYVAFDVGLWYETAQWWQATPNVHRR